MPRPAAAEHAPYYQRYIDKTNGDTIADVVKNHSAEIEKFYTSIPASKADHAYAEGKWTIKQLILHVMDAERIFVYRALRFARKDALQLQGFDEDVYATHSFADTRDFQQLLEEFTALRKSTDLFVSTLNNEQLIQIGFANNTAMSVNAIAFVIYGHLLHHMNVIKERYL
jgi:uncharacterized damage-inducible protein DinB